jgi:hypothetical protein
MLVAKSISGIKIHLLSPNMWAEELDIKVSELSYEDIFDAYCVFSYLVIRFKYRSDPQLDETVRCLKMYRSFLIVLVQFDEISERRNILTSIQAAVFGKTLVSDEFL